MGRQFKQHVYGAVRIAATEGVALSDFNGDATGQDLVSQALTATATLYITLNHPVSNFELRQVSIGYSDSANVDDLAAVYLLEGTDADDDEQAFKVRWQDTDGVAEGLLSVQSDVNTPMNLDTAGQVYFITTWSTAVINCGASEYFYIRIDGVTMEDV
jgi:hypothetical protein